MGSLWRGSADLFSLWGPTFSQLQPIAPYQGCPESCVVRGLPAFPVPLLKLHLSAPAPSPCPSCIPVGLGAPKGSSPACPAQPCPSCPSGPCVSGRRAGPGDAAWGRALCLRIRTLAPCFHLHEPQLWKSLFPLRLSVFIYKSGIKIQIYLARVPLGSKETKDSVHTEGSLSFQAEAFAVHSSAGAGLGNTV